MEVVYWYTGGGRYEHRYFDTMEKIFDDWQPYSFKGEQKGSLWLIPTWENFEYVS